VIWDRRPLPFTHGPATAAADDGNATAAAAAGFNRQPSAHHERDKQGWAASWLGAGFGAAASSSRDGGSGGGEGAVAGGALALAPAAAEYWIVHVLERGLSDAPIRESHLSLRSGERTRRHVSLQRGGEGLCG